MMKYPDFEEPRVFGALSEGHPIHEPESVLISEGVTVDLRYKSKTTTIEVTKVVDPQREFEGKVVGFEGHQLEHGDLKHADLVRFAYDKIEHIIVSRSTVCLDEPATVLWHATLPPEGEVGRAQDRKFARLDDALRFAMQEVPEAVRGTVLVSKDSGDLEIDEIEALYHRLGG